MDGAKFDEKARVEETEIASIQWYSIPPLNEALALTLLRTTSWDSVVKPLPSAPKATRIQTCAEYVSGTLRSLGLNVFVYVLQHFLGIGLDEIPKKAFRRDRVMAFCRAMIHVLPFIVALGEVTINWRGYYIGANIDGLNYLQFAAKLHEMAMQSSLAVIVFAYMRHVVFNGDALPIGAMLSGLHLTQISYLWSMELWGVALSSIPFRRKLSVMSIIVVTVLLASTVGPSSAILMIPNLNYWPAGSTQIWMNITAADLWPSKLDGSVVPEYCSQALDTSNVCPSSEWHALSDYLSLANGILPPSFQGPYSMSPYSIQLTGQGSQRQLIIQHHIYENQSAPYDQAAAQATTQQGAVADALSATSSLWAVALQSSDSPFFDQRDAVQSIVADNYQPYTLASCGADVIQGSTDDRPVAFPIPPGSSPEMLSAADVTDSLLQMLAILHPTLTREEILDTPGSKSDYRVKWVELPTRPFHGSAIGAVILQPTTNDTQGILVCNVAAGWGSSSMNMSSSPAVSGTGVASSSIYDPDRTLPQASDYSQRIAESVVTFGYPLFPQQPVSISESWARYLNPTIPTMNTTVINALMGNKMALRGDTTSANIILAGLVANALSRTGLGSQLQGELRTVFNPTLNASLPDGEYWFAGTGDVFTVDPLASKDWVKLRVDTSVEGYAFGIDGIAAKLTAAVLLIYCALVLAHLLYAATSGISSTSWDSVAEFLVLAVNSAPSMRVRNTCAGIQQMGVFRLPVRVLTRQATDGEEDHLGLVFGVVDEATARRCRVQENRDYGTMLREGEDDDDGVGDERGFRCRCRGVL
ncbi:MAG: hypothetical protein LQ345_006272 [Seirophora villosa]|nr:MAG: hypothetical protein LQ345_006272 [Seirophora villosa]